METLSAIKNRRSIRAFKPIKIPEPLLYEVLEAAQWAPCAGNLQNTRLIIVTDPANKREIVKAALNQDFIAQAPVVIIVCSETDTVKRAYKERGAKLYAIQNTAAAIQNMLLAAHDRGLAACWVGAFTEARLRKVFDIPDNVEIHAIIPIGYANEWPRAPPKVSITDLLYFEKWGELEAGPELKERVWPLSESAPRLIKKVAKKAKKAVKKATKRSKRKKK